MFETIKIITYERGMFDVTEATNLNTGEKYKVSNEEEAIKRFNEVGYQVCAARSGVVFMTKQIER